MLLGLLSFLLYLFCFIFSPAVGEGSGAAEFIDRGRRLLAFAVATHDITSAASAAFREQDVLLGFARRFLCLAFFSHIYILCHSESCELFELTDYAD